MKQAIGDMRLNLGSDPVKKLKSIISDAKGNLSNKNLAEQYLNPIWIEYRCNRPHVRQRQIGRNQKVTQRQQQIPKVEEDLVSGPEEIRLQQILQQHHKRLQNLKQTQSPKRPQDPSKRRTFQKPKQSLRLARLVRSTRMVSKTSTRLLRLLNFLASLLNDELWNGSKE